MNCPICAYDILDGQSRVLVWFELAYCHRTCAVRLYPESFTEYPKPTEPLITGVVTPSNPDS